MPIRHRIQMIGCAIILLSSIQIRAQSQNDKGHYLGHLSWTQSEQFINDAIVIIPFAAGAKEHGPHLPLQTDQFILDYLLDMIVDKERVLIAPNILHGWFPAFREYPGTEIADVSVFQDYVRLIAESLIKSGAKNLVFLNMGINKASGLPLTIVARDIRSNHDIPTLVISWDDLETQDAQQFYQQKKGGHADEGETSIMLYLKPELVNMKLASKDYRNSGQSQIGYTPGKFNKNNEAGLFGDATLANADKGEKILSIMQKNLILALQQFKKSINTTKKTNHSNKSM